VKLAILAAALTILSACASWKSVEQSPADDPFERVQATIPVQFEALHRALLEQPRTLNHDERILPTFPELSLFLVAATDDPIFPDDGSIRINLDRSPWLESYLALPPDARASDLYLYSVTDLFWPSDYLYQAAPAKFYSDFVVHLKPISETETNVEIFEFLPRIWVGKSLQLGAHGPCMCRDQRRVPQTKTDREELLEALQALATQHARSSYGTSRS
jgi:hypothetical protein